MTKLYKLTDKNGYTRAGRDNACLWGENATHSGTGVGGLCGPGWIHAYTHPLLAVMLNPVHAGIANPRLWEAEGEVALGDHGLKVGCLSLTTLREIPLPEVTTEQRVRFAILCVREVYDRPEWLKWAEGWLSGEDRSEAAARAAKAAQAKAVGAAAAGAARASAAAEEARAADAREDERQRQVADIIIVFPLHFFAAAKS